MEKDKHQATKPQADMVAPEEWLRSFVKLAIQPEETEAMLTFIRQIQEDAIASDRIANAKA